MKKQKVVCTKCKTEFEDKPKQSFLGFLIFTCPNCTEKITYPLTGGYRIIYWFVVIGLILYSANAISQGAIPIPGLLGIAAIIGLLKDRSLRNEIRKLNKDAGNSEVIMNNLDHRTDSSGMKYCRECGNGISASTIVCNKCGKEIARQNNPIEKKGDVKKEQEVSRGKSIFGLKINNLSIVLLVVSVVVIGVPSSSPESFLGFALGWLVAVLFLTKGILYLLYLFPRIPKIKEETALNIAMVVYMIIYSLVSYWLS